MRIPSLTTRQSKLNVVCIFPSFVIISLSFQMFLATTMGLIICYTIVGVKRYFYRLYNPITSLFWFLSKKFKNGLSIKDFSTKLDCRL